MWLINPLVVSASAQSSAWNARVPQRHSYPFERQALRSAYIRTVMEVHDSSGGKQQIVGCRPRVVADRSLLVGDERWWPAVISWVYVPTPRR